MRVFRSLGVLFLMMLMSTIAWGQCAMCRATLENNVSHGEAGLAPHLNTGILYLFAMPYILVAIVGFLWYKNSRSAKVAGHTKG